MTKEEKWIHMSLLLTEVSDVLIDRFFDLGSEDMLDEKIEVLTALKDGKKPAEIPNYYSILEKFTTDESWD